MMIPMIAGNVTTFSKYPPYDEFDACEGFDDRRMQCRIVDGERTRGRPFRPWCDGVPTSIRRRAVM